MHRLYLLFFLLPAQLIFSQGDDIILMNTVPIEADRYKGFKGSPYLMEDYAMVTIISVSGEKFENLKGNYNGFENEFEIIQDNSSISLPSKVYPEIQFAKADNPVLMKDQRDTVILKSNIKPETFKGYTIVLHEGTHYTIINHFYVKEHDNEVQTPGIATTFKRFLKKNELWAIADDKLVKFKLSKKQILKTFKEDDAIQKYIKSTKDKLNSEEDLIKMFSEID